MVSLLAANMGPVGSPGFLCLLWLLNAAVEGFVAARILARKGLPKVLVQERFWLINMLSWPLFVVALVSLLHEGAPATASFVGLEHAVVVAEAMLLHRILRDHLADTPERVPGILGLVPAVYAANATSVGLGCLIMAAAMSV